MADKKNAVVKLNLLEPRATEKTYREIAKRTYVFPVDKSASKQQIAKMVEDEFNVTVTDVRVLTRKGKKTKYSKGKHAYPGITHRQDKKFAYVTLKEGNSIKVFEEQEDVKTSAKDAKASKKDKKADKNAGKEKK
ncbi:MAG: 50S ribosomal protein L23 [Candidatus Saccharibacteria bacterium]|nr:50S ribosomal protein L23 [Candidatus Saccharibacteria bacterium]